jgi:hypothetical protein
MDLIPIMLFGCVWDLLLELKGDTQFNSFLDVEIMELNVLLV